MDASGITTSITGNFDVLYVHSEQINECIYIKIHIKIRRQKIRVSY